MFIQPDSIFGVQWTAYAIFMVLVGGLGTFEGPIIGAILLFLIQDWFADQGVWYLIGLGVVAILFALLLPRGLWGTRGGAVRASVDAGGLPCSGIGCSLCGPGSSRPPEGATRVMR